MSALVLDSIHSASAVMASWIRLFFVPGDVTELRAIGVSRPSYRKAHIESGFYDYEHLDDMALAAIRITDHAKGVYFVMNPLRPEILARRANRIEAATGEFLACDRDVVHRKWLLIDCDPVRDPLVSATDDEKASAREVADNVLAYLRTAGWPEPIQADSGNGYHLFYRINMTNDELGTKTARGTLQWLGERFDTPKCKVDKKVFNASRIVKLPGTWARKGDSTNERPHRCSRLLSVPDFDLTGYSKAAVDAVAS